MKILAFDIGGTSIKYGILNENSLTEIHETPTEAHLGGRHILSKIISIAKKESDFDAIGISTAGQVNSDDGFIIYANRNIPDYIGTQIKKELEEIFKVPVAVENDVNSAAIGEAIYGAGKGIPSFLCLTYGTGIGGSIFENGSVYHGSRYVAAEFGAIVTHGPERLSGEDYFDGCYERYASTTALVKKAMEYDPSLDNGRKIFERVDDPAIQKILGEWADEIMLGISTLVHIFNPNCVILGGGIMVQPLIQDLLQQRINKFIMPSFAHVQIKPAVLGNQAGLLGASYLAQCLLKPTLP